MRLLAVTGTFCCQNVFFLNRGFCDIKTPVWKPFFAFWSGYPFYLIAIFTIKRHYKIVVQNLIQYSLKNLSTTLITTRGEKKVKKSCRNNQPLCSGRATALTQGCRQDREARLQADKFFKYSFFNSFLTMYFLTIPPPPQISVFFLILLNSSVYR